MKMGWTGTKQEDQIITVAIEKSTGAKFTYVSFKGGGEVALALVDGSVDSTVNNPIEAVTRKALMIEGAFNQTFLTGAEFAKWLGDEDNRHRTLMQAAGLLGAN